MNILMIGHKSSGKTTYMTSAYGVLQNTSNDFSIKTTDAVVHREFMDQYCHLKDFGKYPPATMKRNVYYFDLYYKEKIAHSFTWKDFNGGVLTESATENAVLLGKDIADSDGLMLFFDSTELKNNAFDRSMRNIIRQLSKNLGDIKRLYFMSVILTKADVSAIQRKEDMEDIVDLLSPLFKILEANENIQCCLVPVCCKKGKIINIDYPILFNLCGGMILYCQNKGEELEKKREDYNRYREKEGLWDDITSFFGGEKTYRKMADELADEVNPQIEKYNQIMEAAQSLIRNLDDRDLYKDFKNINNKYYL